jgi:integrase
VLPLARAALANFVRAAAAFLVRGGLAARPLDGAVAYLPPKTAGSRRRVPLTAETTDLLRGYLAEHPNASNPTAPLFPGMPSAGCSDPDWSTPLRHGTFYQTVFQASGGARGPTTD